MAFREGNSGGDCGCCLPRRGVLAALVGGTAAAALGRGAVAAQPARRIVDVHAHYMPPELKATGPQAGPMATWTVAGHLADMEKAGVARSLLSITTPGITGTGDRAQALVRSSNEYAARICGDNPAKLGFFVYVRLDDIDWTLREIAYGLDVLKAQGVGLFTSYGNKWLGDPAFDPVFAELERRKAVVYVHPTTAACCSRLIPNVADTLIEYGTDTTRAIVSYVYRGAARRYPNVKMIWSHSAGTMPYLIERFDVADAGAVAKAEAPQGFRAAAANFFYDVAQASNPVATGALRKVVPMSQIVFGTDYPFRTQLDHVRALDAGKVFNGAELGALYRGNVERGLPSLLAAPG
ncbi:MAG: amidohydrolase family protein [Caulobacteraceae bacterium]